MFLHWSLLVGAVSDEVKLSVNVAADPMISTTTVDVPSSWKFPFGVRIVAVYGTPVTFALPKRRGPQLSVPGLTFPALLPVIVVVPEVIVNVASAGSAIRASRAPFG